MGQSLTANDTLEFTVTGVMQNVLPNSHFEFDFMASYHTLQKLGFGGGTWWSFGGYNYLMLAEGTNVARLGQKLHRVSAKYIPEQETGSEKLRRKSNRQS